MRRMYSENQLKEVVNKGIQEGAIEIPISETKLYNHIVLVGETNDPEDNPWLVFMFQSTKASYTKNEIEDFVKNVASFSYTDVAIMGIPCYATNTNYAVNSQGSWHLLWNEDDEEFIGRQTENVASNTSIAFGEHFGYFRIESKEI